MKIQGLRGLLLCLLLICPAQSLLAAQADPLVKLAQNALKTMGYDPGSADGFWGKNTADALRQYQQAEGLNMSGKLDDATKISLGLQTPEDKSTLELAVKASGMIFRSVPAALSQTDILSMIAQQGFHHPDDYSGVGLSGSVTGRVVHDYEVKTFYDEPVVIDHASGLIWQQRPAAFVPGKTIERYIRSVNTGRYAGFSDWRLPTIEELGSLLESPEKAVDFLNPAFDIPFYFCLSADTVTGDPSKRWTVFFESGYIIDMDADDDFYALLVRDSR